MTCRTSVVSGGGQPWSSRFGSGSGGCVLLPLRLLRPRVEVIGVKLLISLISRRAARRFDLTGEPWASSETTDLQPKLWIGDVPKLELIGGEGASVHDDTTRSTAGDPVLPADSPCSCCACIQPSVVLHGV